VDETGITDVETPRLGWGFSGVRVPGPRRGRREKRVSIAGCSRSNRLTGAMILEGGFDRAAFIAFLTHVLLPVCMPGGVIVMDNACIHKGHEIDAIIAAKGCRLLYQPKYSPDLNPIEHLWSPLKNDIRQEIARDLKSSTQTLFEKASSVLNRRLRL